MCLGVKWIFALQWGFTPINWNQYKYRLTSYHRGYIWIRSQHSQEQAGLDLTLVCRLKLQSTVTTGNGTITGHGLDRRLLAASGIGRKSRALIQRVHHSPRPRARDAKDVPPFDLALGRRGGLVGERRCCWRSELYRLAEVHADCLPLLPALSQSLRRYDNIT